MSVLCTIEFNKTKSKWGRKEVEEDIPKREAQGLAWQDRKEDKAVLHSSSPQAGLWAWAGSRWMLAF